MESRDKKTTVNLFIDKNIINEIRKEADNKGISLNSRLNNILTDYVWFYKRAEEFQSVTFPKEYFQFVLDNIDEQKLTEFFDTLLSGLIPTVLLDFKVPITRKYN